MTAEEYFNYRRDQAHLEYVTQAGRLMESEEFQLGQIDSDRLELAKTLKAIRAGFHWVTIHWLVPHGSSQRAETISGRVKDVHKNTIEFWVDSTPDETALHGIAHGDILEVPFEAVTSVSAPVAT